MSGLAGELADRDHRSDERERFDDGIDPRAVRQAGINPWARRVDTPSDGSDDPVDDSQHVLVVQKVAVNALDLPAALDVDVAWAIDHDLGDRLVEKERIEWPEAADLADQFLDQA